MTFPLNDLLTMNIDVWWCSFLAYNFTQLVSVHKIVKKNVFITLKQLDLLIFSLSPKSLFLVHQKIVAGGSETFIRLWNFSFNTILILSIPFEWVSGYIFSVFGVCCTCESRGSMRATHPSSSKSESDGRKELAEPDWLPGPRSAWRAPGGSAGPHSGSPPTGPCLQWEE